MFAVVIIEIYDIIFVGGLFVGVQFMVIIDSIHNDISEC